MKKLLICLLLLTAVGTSAQESYSLEEVGSRWAGVVIKNVKSGSLTDMLAAFYRQWPTFAVGDAVDVMQQGLTSKVFDDDTEYQVQYYPKNGFVEVFDAGTDFGHMAACYWNRSNGHRLFAVNIGQPVDPEIEIVCFYDYDDAAKTLTPVKGLLAALPAIKAGEQRYYGLPKEGKNMVVTDYTADYVKEHRFTWDGMKPVYSKTVDRVYDFDATEVDGGYDVPVSFSGKAPGIVDFVNARLAEEDLGEVLGAVHNAWQRRQQGKALPANTIITVDAKNGYMRYERTYPEANERSVVEMCYWNCADGTHKIMAENIMTYQDGKRLQAQYDGITFHIYDATQKAMKWMALVDLCGESFADVANRDGTVIALPRQGKNVRVDLHRPDGTVQTHWLRWTGNMFSYQ